MKLSWLKPARVSALLLCVFAAAFGVSAFADEKPASFHMVCWYDNDAGSPFGHRCRAALDFTAPVTIGGGEDGGPCKSCEPTPDHDRIDSMVITCDANPWGGPNDPLMPVYNDGGIRITGLLGTEFMGSHGPTPEVVVGRGELHAGPHVAPSTLLMDVDNRLLHSHGMCKIMAEILPH